MKPSWASVVVPLALPLLFLTGCLETSDAPPAGDLVQKAGSSTTPIGCLSGLTGALSMAVRDLHFRRNCSRDAETGKFNWAYIHGDKLQEGDPVDTVEKCIDRLATALNDNIPYLEISLNERCSKRVKMFNGEKLVWAFDYRGR
jgi:hypothetical protein